MIPKTIHYCWLSEDKFPDKIETCIASWKKHLPDYEFVLWDTKKFDIQKELWTQQAFDTRKYAFASDYIRLYALYHYGGIYLDCDVEVFKSFNDLLELDYFIGYEQSGLLEAAVIGSEKGSKWLLDCLEYYQNRPFIKSDGNLDTEILPKIMERCIEKTRTISDLDSYYLENVKQLPKNDTSFKVFPYEFFSAKNHDSYRIDVTPNTYTVHHFTNLWVPKRLRLIMQFKRAVIRIIGVDNTTKIGKWFGLRKVRKSLTKAVKASQPKYD